MRHARVGSLLAALACLGAGCGGTPAGLPEFAAPRGRVLALDEEVPRDLIHYRELARDDFQSPQPPPQYEPHRERLGAATCAYILILPESPIEVVELRSPDGPTLFRAVPTGLGFRARMDPGCSWWNSEQTELPPDYVLEHEQIHFALFEIEARRLDARSEALADAATAFALTEEEAARRSYERLEATLTEALGEALRRNREFDEDTSMGFRPERQEVWRERVRAELAGTP